MPRRRKMTKRQSRKSFRYGAGVHRRNDMSNVVMRGGIRL